MIRLEISLRLISDAMEAHAKALMYVGSSDVVYCSVWISLSELVPVSSVGRAFGFYRTNEGKLTEMSGVRAPYGEFHFLFLASPGEVT